ncbi:hypothetical protein C5E02_10745 [Rathayibacter rathayi]|uniref:Uncharacterized protein n=1 Tax=Rathayibacter rathayi TaxID=33887 RepID=A0ABD6W4Q4_RATRA|nr:hypothetical protein C1O28_11050 [Rathayibacter rathayi]SOE05453.1 hypothetical protein SAMN06295924_109140 [Rathayibacter rathayi NCPPB 2980 = VKM Ac-1601]PPF09636.1 hypothetical protein C5C04_14505 [Rathayibacter rathayi]PPF21392.1 hypothetical protein C5C34_13185 [Rathayibacter rathayi]PPF42775.1 hypothetical protein C5C08_14630 [Rathayibacter rathayi]
MGREMTRGNNGEGLDARGDSDASGSRKGHGITLVGLAVAAVGLLIVQGGRAVTWFDFATTAVIGVLALVLLLTGLRLLRAR